MAQITLGGVTAQTNGELLKPGDNIKDFKLVGLDLQDRTLSDYKGTKLVMNIFPSVNTGVCSAALRQFDKLAAGVENTTILNISKDLPFSQNNFCNDEGIKNIVMLSDFRYGTFGQDYGVLILDGNFGGLLSRCVIVADENGKVLYSEQVPEIGQEPNYDAAMAALKG